MKTSINPVFILYSSLRKKPAALPGPCADKTFDNRKMATITRQLIYESTVDDVFWVLHTKIRGKNSWSVHTDNHARAARNEG